MTTTVGLIGRPGTGKSTLFSLVTGHVPEPMFLKTGIKPSRAVAPVPDERLDALARVLSPGKVTAAKIELLDLPGFSTGDDRKLITAALSNYRTCDALAIVADCFSEGGASGAAHETGELIDELILMDLLQVEGLMPSLKKHVAGKEEGAAIKLSGIEKVLSVLSGGKPANRARMNPEEEFRLQEYSLVTLRPLLVVGNFADDAIADTGSRGEELKALAERYDAGYLAVSAGIEEELSRIADEKERSELEEEFGIKEPGRDRFALACFDLLGLKTFFTSNEKELKAWTIGRGGTVLDAAGEIHSDIARGFIRAEVYKPADILELGGLAAVKGAGRMKSAGKDHVFDDGDLIFIHFRH